MIFTDLRRVPRTFHYGIALALVLMIIFVGYLIYIRPDLARYTVLVQQEENLQQKYAAQQQKTTHLTYYRQQLRILQKKFVHMPSQLPVGNVMPLILEIISRIGKECAVTFALFAPLPKVIHRTYSESPINITLFGDYTHLMIFLKRIAALNCIITMHDLDIATDNWRDNHQLPANALPSLLRMKIMIKIYQDSFSRLYKIHELYPSQNISKHVQRDPFSWHHIAVRGEQLNTLTLFSLKSLKFVGILRNRRAIWGLVQLPNQHHLVVKVQAGDCLGKERKKIVRITEQYILLKPTV